MFGVVVLVIVSCVVNATAPASGAIPTFGFAHVTRDFGLNGISALDHWTEIRDLAEVSDGALLLRVTRRDAFGAAVAEGVVRLRADGSLDPTFAVSGLTPGELTVPLDAGTHLLVRSDGRIHLSDGVVLQYTATGEPDLTFGNNGRGFFSVGGPAFELADGFVLHAAPQQVALGGLGLQVFSPTGAQDLSRLVFTGLETNKIIPLQAPGGAHLVVTYNSPLASEPGHLLAIRPDGSLDTSFGGGDGIAPLQFDPNSAGPGLLFDAALQADGRVVMLFNSGSIDRLRVMRFNSDGSRDASFGVDGNIYVQGCGGGSVVTEPNGRIDLVLWYRFEDPPVNDDDPNKTFVVRLLTNGAIDPTFNVNGSEVGSVTLGELAVSDRSGAARALRLRSGDLVVARTQLGPTSSLELVRIAFDESSTPLPVASTITGPAQAGLFAQAHRLGVVADP